MFDEVESLIASASHDSIFWMRVSEDKEKVVRAALLAVLAADIASIPDQRSRASHIDSLIQLCGHFDLKYDDVRSLAAQMSALEASLAGRTLPANDTV